MALAAAAGTLAVCAGIGAWMVFAPRSVPPGQPPLTRLEKGALPLLLDAFNAPGQDARLLVMLSPT
ncbi:MAG TPA: hypothetical protein VJV23_07665 [Candidatus Polarisedimenticolia bacterium]|nr:hypothetical protein [Candidatus Polarisedimenticolia bacterium]